MYTNSDWDDTYPEGIASYSEGLPLRGYPGTLTEKNRNLEKVLSPIATCMEAIPMGLGMGSNGLPG